MKRVAAMSVVRGEGECRVIVDHVVQKEVERLQAIARRQLEEERMLIQAEMRYLRSESNTIRSSRNRMLSEKMEALSEITAEMRRPGYRIKSGIAFCVATVYCAVMRIMGRSF